VAVLELRSQKARLSLLVSVSSAEAAVIGRNYGAATSLTARSCTALDGKRSEANCIMIVRKLFMHQRPRA
jgi:hypothetical protein